MSDDANDGPWQVWGVRPGETVPSPAGEYADGASRGGEALAYLRALELEREGWTEIEIRAVREAT